MSGVEIGRPRRPPSVERVDVTAGEVELGPAQQPRLVRDLFFEALQVAGEHGARRPRIPLRQRHPCQAGPIGRGQLVDVRLQEDRMIAVEGVQEPVEKLGGQLGVEGMMCELRVPEDVRGQLRDVGVRRPRVGRAAGGARGGVGAGGRRDAATRREAEGQRRQ